MHHSLKTARLLLSEAGFFVLLIFMLACSVCLPSSRLALKCAA